MGGAGIAAGPPPCPRAPPGTRARRCPLPRSPARRGPAPGATGRAQSTLPGGRPPRKSGKPPPWGTVHAYLRRWRRDGTSAAPGRHPGGRGGGVGDAAVEVLAWLCCSGSPAIPTRTTRGPSSSSGQPPTHTPGGTLGTVVQLTFFDARTTREERGRYGGSLSTSPTTTGRGSPFLGRTAGPYAADHARGRPLCSQSPGVHDPRLRRAERQLYGVPKLPRRGRQAADRTIGAHRE